MAAYNFTIHSGATFNPRLKYSQPHLVVKTITGITKSGQAVVTCTHSLSVDWPVWVSGVAGMVQINHTAEDLQRPSKSYQGYYVDATSMRLNVDSSRFSAYTSGGELLYHPPVDLTGYTATMTIKDVVGGTTLLTLTEASGITLGTTDGVIDLLISGAVTGAWTWTTAVYDLDLTDTAGVITNLSTGSILVESV